MVKRSHFFETEEVGVSSHWSLQPNGTVYTFGRDVNILWRHGIPQVHPSDYREEGRISIICWGWIEMFDM